MKNFLFQRLLVAIMLLGATNWGKAQVRFDIDAGLRGPKIGARHYGIFFEEINHAGDGGLYAELIQNRSFEDNNTNPDKWWTVGSATTEIVTDHLLNNAQQHALKLTMNAPGDGIRNEGFWGINSVEGRTYKLCFWARSVDGYNGRLNVGLQSKEGDVLGGGQVEVNLGAEWQKISTEFTATVNDPEAWFSLSGTTPGEIILDVVSLFPPTYKGRENGCRIDLAEMLQAIQPAFVRFPGGCYVEGQWTNGKTNRFEWKNTIGPIEERPGHRNINWNYNVSDGLGFHEMLQLTEDLGAEPLFVVNMGMGHGWVEDYNHIDEYIQEALDAIEYCNGDITTPWGAKRAQNGHSEPFNLRLIEIGNENYNYSFDNNNDQSDHYAERYKKFYDAIKTKYPEMIIIGNVEAWGTDNPSWRNNHPVDAVDEHYYRSPGWFVNQYTKYDNRNRALPKVYVGEYAVTEDYGTNGHLRAALGEAVYMLGMENNSDVCIMNSYAPTFVNENDQKWRPDMIRFDSDKSFGTPSYHVQQLFPNNVGTQNLKWTESANEMSEGDQIGLSTWRTTAIFDNVKITRQDGQVIFSDNFSRENGSWTSLGGRWSVSNGVLNQNSSSMEGKIYLCSASTGDNYTLELDATKTGGAEGFLIAFKFNDEKNYCWWNLGGWDNSKHAIEVCKDGAKSTVESVSGNLQTGHTYKVKIIVSGGTVKCYLDEKLIHDITLPVSRKVYISSNINDESGMLYVKMVNPTNQDVPAVISIKNADIAGGNMVVMSGGSEDENTMQNPTYVYPQEKTLSGWNGNTITYTLPAYSLNIFRLKVENIDFAEQEGQQATEAMIKTFREELKGTMNKLNFLHASTSLPSSTASGALMEWELKDVQNTYVSLSSNGYNTMLLVNTLPQDKGIQAATLIAHVTFPDKTVADVEYSVNLAPDDNRYGYLYCFINSGKEITNFALGTKEDLGKRFQVLLGGAEVFDTDELARIEGGTRDAFILRGERENQYLMATTDMCVAKTGRWNNYGMDLLRSTDMIHWESTTFDFRLGKSIFSDPEAVTGFYNSDSEYAKINRVWAPQMIWDSSKNAYLVYYSLLSSNEGDTYDKIYYSYADADFKTLTQPRIFFDPGFSVIDADIVLNPYDGLYHMYYKREAANGTDRGVYEATSPLLVGGTWTDITHVTNEGSEQVEGSSVIRRINEDVYNLYYMRYSGGSAYKVCETDHIGLNTSSSTNLQGTGAFQHGSFMTLTEEEYKMLEIWNQLTLSLPLYKEKQQNSGTSLFDEPIANAEAALKLTSVTELAKELPKAYQGLLDADAIYKEENLEGATEDNPIDCTYLIANADFSNGGDGWEGTTFTAANGSVAEQWNKTFDNYQVLRDMPAGKYVLSCQGFYRYGNRGPAYEAHLNNTDEVLAQLYMNEASTPFACIFSEESYGEDYRAYPNNVDDANIAFNTKGFYTGISVEFTLTEPGDLKIGMRKLTPYDEDWTIFDNFSLTYYGAQKKKLDSGVYYIKNVATNLFLTAANSWGTQASLAETGLDVIVEELPNGLYTLDTKIYNSDAQHYLAASGYMDGSMTEWSIKELLGYDGEGLALSTELTDASFEGAQWMFLTKEDLITEMKEATTDEPYNATFLLPAAGFSRNDDRNKLWTDAPAIGGEVMNTCGEKWNTTAFDIHQELSQLPNGYYQINAQGFYRMGGGENNGTVAAENHLNGTETLNAELYANESSTPLISIMNEAKLEDTPDEGIYFNTSIGYIPQRMEGASAFFNEGLYNHSLWVRITDGTLRVGIRKKEGAINDWTIFDNFRLTYYGENLPDGISETDILQEVDVIWPTDVYDITGRVIKKKAYSMQGFSPGFYVVQGRKIVIQ